MHAIRQEEEMHHVMVLLSVHSRQFQGVQLRGNRRGNKDVKGRNRAVEGRKQGYEGQEQGVEGGGPT